MKDALFVLGDGAWCWVLMRSAVPSTVGYLKHSYLTGMCDMGAEERKHFCQVYAADRFGSDIENVDACTFVT